MRIGFIGTGTITEAIVTGLCRSGRPPEEIWISSRSEHRALALEKAWPRVRIAAPNQAVADNADILFLAFLPGQETGILNRLAFRRDQVIVTLLAGVPLSRIRELTAPARTVIRAIPLPCTALNTGPVVMFPDEPRVNTLFSLTGSVLVPEKEEQLEIFSIITALMAPFYALTDTVAAWGEARGLDRAQAAAYTSAMFKALALIAETAPDGDIGTLVADSMTPGGLNETAMAVISENKGFQNIISALDEVVKKVR
ncbi:MAG: NAD(P)-binding domain-containing protein [Desulfobacterales bacterium]|nr:NAD(P)-binding domain-containing protein [Desulfobacterales bacterium]